MGVVFGFHAVTAFGERFWAQKSPLLRAGFCCLRSHPFHVLPGFEVEQGSADVATAANRDLIDDRLGHAPELFQELGQFRRDRRFNFPVLQPRLHSRRQLGNAQVGRGQEYPGIRELIEERQEQVLRGWRAGVQFVNDLDGAGAINPRVSGLPLPLLNELQADAAAIGAFDGPIGASRDQGNHVDDGRLADSRIAIDNGFHVSLASPGQALGLGGENGTDPLSATDELGRL